MLQLVAKSELAKQDYLQENSTLQVVFLPLNLRHLQFHNFYLEKYWSFTKIPLSTFPLSKLSLS
jgi:hypothetical protein